MENNGKKNKSIVPALIGGGFLLWLLSKNKTNQQGPSAWEQLKNDGKYLISDFDSIKLSDLNQTKLDREDLTKNQLSIIPYVVPNSLKFSILQNYNVFPHGYSVSTGNWYPTIFETYNEDQILVCEFLFNIYVPDLMYEKIIVEKFSISDISLYYNGNRFLDNAVTMEMFAPQNDEYDFWYNSSEWKNITNYYHKYYLQNLVLKQGNNVFRMGISFPYRWKGHFNRFRQDIKTLLPSFTIKDLKYYNQFDIKNPFIVMDELSFKTTLKTNLGGVEIERTNIIQNSDDDNTSIYEPMNYLIVSNNKNEFSQLNSIPIEQRGALSEFLKSLVK